MNALGLLCTNSTCRNRRRLLIYSWHRLHDCHAILVDLTGRNSNVLYELGRAHQYGGVQPLILFRGGKKAKLPYYVGRIVQFVGNDANLAGDIIGRQSPKKEDYNCDLIFNHILWTATSVLGLQKRRRWSYAAMPRGRQPTRPPP